MIKITRARCLIIKVDLYKKIYMQKYIGEKHESRRNIRICKRKL